MIISFTRWYNTRHKYIDAIVDPIHNICAIYIS
jgi:hypothetical protein